MKSEATGIFDQASSSSLPSIRGAFSIFTAGSVLDWENNWPKNSNKGKIKYLFKLGCGFWLNKYKASRAKALPPSPRRKSYFSQFIRFFSVVTCSWSSVTMFTSWFISTRCWALAREMITCACQISRISSVFTE